MTMELCSILQVLVIQTIHQGEIMFTCIICLTLREQYIKVR